MSSDAEIAISARGLSKSYEVYRRPEHRLWQLLFGRLRTYYSAFPAVRGVDLDVYRGETVGIVGRNGSGKSTLLKMISGVLSPTAGDLEVHGHVAPILSLGVGFNPDFSGEENLRMSATLLGLSDDEFAAKLGDIRAFADIGAFFGQPIRSYSSGMIARLAFALAIHAKPDILVIDEVLAVGDEAFARKCFGKLEQLKEQGSTILFVSHASNLVVQLCDRAVLLDAGTRLLTGDPKTVIALYHRLLYAEKPGEVRREILDLDAGEPEPPVPDAAAPNAPAVARFNPELRSESLIEYASLGARVVNPRILDAHDQIVNVLEAGQSYRYAYDVEFDQTVFGVRFGMMIKLITGLELSGQASHPWARGLEVVEAGSRARVSFGFRALLAPGVYFLNAGVLGLGGDGEHYLHRILDALMFRVETSGEILATGHVDLMVSGGAEVVVEDPS